MDELEQLAKELSKNDPDMPIINKIFREYQTRSLTTDELKLLYRISYTLGFNSEKNEKVRIILKNRSIEQDISTIAKEIKVWEGSFDLPQETLEGTDFPEEVEGEMFFYKLKTAKGIKFPKKVKDNFTLMIETVEGLVLPDYIGGDLYLPYVQDASGLKCPSYVGKDFCLSSATNFTNMTPPEYIGRSILLGEHVDGFPFPNTVYGDIDVYATVLKNLAFSKKVYGELYCSDAIYAENIEMPVTVGAVNFSDLKEVKNVRLSQTIQESFDIRNLTSIEGFIVPENFTCKNIYSSHNFTVDSFRELGEKQKQKMLKR